MPDITSIIKQKPTFHMRVPASAAQIDIAEKALGLRFSNEYLDYLAAFGAVSIYGHEFTGLCAAKRLDVVAVTLSEREINQNIPSDFYVLERLNIDDIVIWQSSSGSVYQTIGDSEPAKFCNSFCDYITLNT